MVAQRIAHHCLTARPSGIWTWPRWCLFVCSLLDGPGAVALALAFLRLKVWYGFKVASSRKPLYSLDQYALQNNSASSSVSGILASFLFVCLFFLIWSPLEVTLKIPCMLHNRKAMHWPASNLHILIYLLCFNWCWITPEFLSSSININTLTFA